MLNLQTIQNRKRVDKLNLTALGVAAGQGSKEANKEINKMNMRVNKEARGMSGETNTAVTPLNDISEEELLKLNVGRKKRN